MPITISGSTGIAGVDGSASTPAVQGTDTNTGIAFPAADTVAIGTGGTERMRVDSSGNVGIGTSSPLSGVRLTVQGNFSCNGNNIVGGGTSAATANITGGTTFSTDGAAIALRGSTAGYNNHGMEFYAGGTERARITTGGEFLVGVTTGNGPAGTIGSKGYQSRSGSAGGFSGNVFNIYWTGAAAQLWIDTTNVGNITLSSDYRIKRNVGTQDQPALARVLQLRPVTYQMADYGNIIKSSDDVLEGFIAHELADVIPSAVNGVKDAPDQLQSLKLDALCSVLVKAIQELKAENDDLKARLTALEAK